jgi:hypothetical protein
LEYRPIPRWPYRDAFAGYSERVRQFKPLIIRLTKQFAARYYLNPWALLSYALLIAAKADKRFDERRNTSFGTFLEWHLQGLHRVCKGWYRALYGNHHSEAFRTRRPRKPSHRDVARRQHGDITGRIRWDDHRPRLLELEHHQGNSLRLAEKALLDWMLDRDGRTLADVAVVR